MQGDVEARLKLLMVQGLAGDAAAWRIFLEALAKRLRAYFGRRLAVRHAYEIDDLIQETLIAVHERRATYDPGQPVTAWAYAIARYKLIDFWRRHRLRRHVPLEDAADDLWCGPDESGQAAADLERILTDLPPKQQALIRDVKIQGESLAAAGARQGLKEGAAKVALHRAVARLKDKVARRAQ